MPEYLPTYDDPFAESILLMGPTGGDTILISTVAHVTSRLENGFDKQRKAGSNFGRVKFLGVLPAEFTVTFVVLPEDEEDFWGKIVPLIRPKQKAGSAPPVDIINPNVNRIGIETVTIVSCDIEAPNARDGRMVTLQLEEWTPAPVKSKKKDLGKIDNDPLNLAATATATNQG